MEEVLEPPVLRSSRGVCEHRVPGGHRPMPRRSQERDGSWAAHRRARCPRAHGERLGGPGAPHVLGLGIPWARGHGGHRDALGRLAEAQDAGPTGRRVTRGRDADGARGCGPRLRDRYAGPVLGLTWARGGRSLVVGAASCARRVAATHAPGRARPTSGRTLLIQAQVLTSGEALPSQPEPLGRSGEEELCSR